MMPPESPAVVVDGLTKTYGPRRAVDGLTFRVARGEIFALLGPNGAGKTTTVEIMEGYKRPDGGTVRVLGLDPVRDARPLRAKIGVMLQEGGLYPAITSREAVHLFSRFYDHPHDPDDLLRLVGLEAAAEVRYRRLSGGQKQRLALALALVPRPELVFLDEPTTGLDPQARRSTWDVISSLQAEGVTVVLTTHYLEEAERLADRVGIIDEGHLVALDSTAGLLRSDSSIVRVRTGGPIDAALLGSLPAARSVRSDGANVFVLETDDPPSLLVEIATLLRDVNVPALELRSGDGSLEDVFLRLTGKELER